MQRSRYAALVAGAVLLTAAPVGAEQYPGWYGGVDLGYNTLISRSVVVSEAECLRRDGRLGARRGGVGVYCNARTLPLPVRTAPIRSINDIGWLSSDSLAREFAGACARASGRVATSGEYGYCLPSTAVRR